MIPIDELMVSLALRRPIFHSEADFQHELAWEARHALADVQVRLELPFPGRASGAIDLVFYRSGIAHAVELKYLTGLFAGEIGGEEFRLKNHGAQDIRSYDVCRDIERMETFCSGPGRCGSVVVLTNDPYYSKARLNSGTCAAAFDISGHRPLSGSLSWADHTGGTKKGREAAIALTSSYLPEWKNYSDVGGMRGRFRYFHLPVRTA